MTPRSLGGRGGVLIAAAVASLVSAPMVHAQVTSAPDPAALEEALEAAASLLEGSYVFPEDGSRYAALLRANADEYAELGLQALAQRATADLQAVKQDLHLRLVATAPVETIEGGRRVRRAPGGSPAGQAGGAPGRVRVGGNPGGGAPGAAVPRASSPDQLFSPIDINALPDMARGLYADETSRNHFFTKVEVLPGNIGYLDYDQFGFPNFSKDAADAAFGFLAETDALILDLRDNRGGIEGMNQYLASHFFGDEPVHLYSRYYGSANTTVEYVTFPEHVMRRFPDRPLFVLVNRGTGSAAENFSFAMQGLGRATIVGQPTAGAAHSSRAFPVGAGLVLQLPIARAFNPRTGEDWEGTGVLPDVEIESTDALRAAHSRAVDRLIETADAGDREGLEEARLLYGATIEAPAGMSEDATEFVGEYGTRRVFTESGALKMMRTDVEGAQALDLVRLAADYYTLEQASIARIRFERDDEGRVVRMMVRGPGGTWDTADRR